MSRIVDLVDLSDDDFAEIARIKFALAIGRMPSDTLQSMASTFGVQPHSRIARELARREALS